MRNKKLLLGLVMGMAFLLGSITCPVQADWLGEMQSGEAIDLPGTYGTQEMAIGFDESNNGLAVFMQKDTSFYNLFPSKQTYGGTLWVTNNVRVNNTSLLGVGDVRDPEIDVSDSGIGLCVYAQYTNGFFHIFGARYHNSSFSAINGSNRIDVTGGYNAEQPSVVQVNDNTSIVTYLQYNGAENRIYSSKWENDTLSFWSPTGWTNSGGALSIDGLEKNASRPHMVESSTGDIYCVYAKEGTPKSIYVSVYRNEQWYYWGVGGWISSGNAAPISIMIANHYADRPRITALPNGEMLCVYELIDDTDESSHIHFTRYDGQNWSPADTVTMVDTLAPDVNASAPDIASSPRLDKIICVYAKGDTGTAAGQHVFASEWADNAWKVMNGGFAIDSRGNTASSITPKIKFDHRGNAIALYQQWDISDNKTRVFANYFQGPPYVETITPDSGTNNGITSVVVTGYSFAGGTTAETKVSACLRQAGQSDIVGTNVEVATPTGNFFTATAFSVDFDLTGTQVGDWDLVVENPDGQLYIKSSAFGVTWPDLDKAYAYPNPIKLTGSGGQTANSMRFYNLVRAVEVRIYTVKGELIRTLAKDDRQLFVDWDMRNEAGHKVAPGIYLYRVDSTTDGSMQTGKCMVIR